MATRAAVNASCTDADDFCRVLGKRTGRTVCLPTGVPVLQQ